MEQSQTERCAGLRGNTWVTAFTSITAPRSITLDPTMASESSLRIQTVPADPPSTRATRSRSEASFTPRVTVRGKRISPLPVTMLRTRRWPCSGSPEEIPFWYLWAWIRTCLSLDRAPNGGASENGGNSEGIRNGKGGSLIDSGVLPCKFPLRLKRESSSVIPAGKPCYFYF